MGHHLRDEIYRRSRQGELKPEVLKVWRMDRLIIASLILWLIGAAIVLGVVGRRFL